jgi:hypothetical protein
VLLGGGSFQARSLLGLLMLMGVIVGFSVGCMAISVPWFFPQIFTKDLAIISQMQSVTLPLFCSLVITPPTHALEGTLLVIALFFQFNYFNNPFTILIIHCCFSHGCIHHE